MIRLISTIVQEVRAGTIKLEALVAAALIKAPSDVSEAIGQHED